jgi:hypothetical protein
MSNGRSKKAKSEAERYLRVQWERKQSKAAKKKAKEGNK